MKPTKGEAKRTMPEEKNIDNITKEEVVSHKIRVYLDNCAYNRPYDDQSQFKIELETLAKLKIQRMIKDHQILCCESPQSICHAFNGKVFEIPAGVKIPSSCIHLSERREREGTVIRVFSKSPVVDGIPVIPNLEDVFLTIYQEGEE